LRREKNQPSPVRSSRCDAIDPTTKRPIMLAALLVISLGAFGLAHLEGHDPDQQVHRSIKIKFTFAV
jgi:hypothetical protein